MTSYYNPDLDKRPGMQEAADLAGQFKRCVEQHGLHGVIFYGCLTIPNHASHEARVGRVGVMLWKRDHPGDAPENASGAERLAYEHLARMVLSV